MDNPFAVKSLARGRGTLAQSPADGNAKTGQNHEILERLAR
jgi:hypothetical protein